MKNTTEPHPREERKEKMVRLNGWLIYSQCDGLRWLRAEEEIWRIVDIDKLGCPNENVKCVRVGAIQLQKNEDIEVTGSWNIILGLWVWGVWFCSVRNHSENPYGLKVMQCGTSENIELL